MSGRHQREATRGSFLSPTTSVSITASIITVMCIARGRVLVLTPGDEHEGRQEKQSARGWHRLRQVAPGVKQIPSVKHCALSDAFEETLWGKLPRGGDFLTGRRAKRPWREAPRDSGAELGFRSQRPEPAACLGGRGLAAPHAVPAGAAGVRLSTTDSTFPAHPGTCTCSRSAASRV